MAASLEDEQPVYDLVGVGFGPSNLSLAVALAEHNAKAVGTDRADVITAHFVERQPRFGWHRGMLIEDATMQVSFLKDLVTLRNPSSEYSFLSYLHDRGRLIDFINHKTLFPLRVEFHDYLEWCAARVDDQVTYGHDVLNIDPVEVDGEVRYFDIVTHSGGSSDEPLRLRARNVIMATGLSANLPDGVTAGERVWHNSELLRRVASLDTDAAQRFVVVGAGQSAAETTAFLHERFPRAEVCSVFSRYGYSPSDDSPFANRIFDPAAVDAYFDAPEPLKQRLMDYHANTNYSAVDLELIEDLYRRTYREKVLGAQRLRWFNASRVTEVDAAEDGVRAVVESTATGARTVLAADAIVYATGYRPDESLPQLGELADRCHRDELGRPVITRDYRVETDEHIRAGIYMQGGGTEHTHGITSSLLSNNAIRAGEILRSVLDHRQQETHADRPLEASGTRQS